MNRKTNTLMAALLSPSLIWGGAPVDVQREAIMEFKAGHFKQAADLYKGLAALNPSDIDLLRDLMWAYWNAGLQSETIETAKAILHLRESDTEAHGLLAKVYANGGNRSGAIHEYENVLRQNPGNFSAKLTLARLYAQSGDITRAESMLHELEKDIPGTPSLKEKVGDVWKFVARSYTGKDSQAKAITSYEHIMGREHKEDIQVKIALARLYMDKKEYALAEDTLVAALAQSPDTKSIYAKLASVRFYRGNYVQSADTWDSAIRAYPELAEFRYKKAEALYFAGQYDNALHLMDDLLNDPQQGRRALDFVVDDALTRGDHQAVVKTYEENLGDVGITDHARLMRLATAYERLHNLDGAIRTLNRALRNFPGDGDTAIALAVCYFEKGDSWRAIRTLNKVLLMNPSAISAMYPLADTYAAQGRNHRILDLLDRFAKVDPTNVYILTRRADVLYTMGRRTEAKQLLIDWLEKTPKEILPVFLYHGLTPFKRDPMLAHSQHVSAKTFESHIAALKRAGYTPVTVRQIADWYNKRDNLPRRPVLIAFDDGRMDAFRNADPILEKYNFKATMFVIGQNADRVLPNYATWTDLRRFQKNGRWEMQGHTDKGHGYIQIDDEGHKGLFLVNRQWLPGANRLETRQEWAERVNADHQRSKEKMNTELGVNPNGFAFPEGNFGQNDTPNFKDSARLNINQISKFYEVSFFQDSYGINTAARDPLLLNRLEPPATWTGDDLVRHIMNKNPFSRIRSTLLEWAVWEGKTREAFHWMEELQKGGASPALLAAEESRIRADAGDMRNARQLEQQARDGGWKPSGGGDRTSPVRKQSRWSANADGFYLSDNVHRRNWVFQPSIETGYVGDTRLRGFYQHGNYIERNEPDITENAAGLAAQIAFGLYHHLELSAMGHNFSGGDAASTASGFIDYSAAWTDNFRSQLNVSRAPVAFAGALNQNIRKTSADATLAWGSYSRWTTKAQSHIDAFTDNNQRVGGRLEIIRSWEGGFNPQIIARVEGNHNTRPSAFYYSPLDFGEGAIGVGASTRLMRQVLLSLVYLPGMGKETGLSTRFVQNLTASLKGNWRDAESAEISYQFSKTPSYRSNFVEFKLSHQFGSGLFREASPKNGVSAPEAPQPEMGDGHPF